MKCSLLTLSCALDGELSRERQAALDAHLITCERCRTGMRYLREETERISALAQVELDEAVATALLERSRVLVGTASGESGASAAPPVPMPPPEPVEQPIEERRQIRVAPDPFGSAGLDAAILEPPSEIVPSAPAPEGPTGPVEAEMEPAEPSDQGLAPLTPEPAASAEEVDEWDLLDPAPSAAAEVTESPRPELETDEGQSVVPEDVWLAEGVAAAAEAEEAPPPLEAAVEEEPLVEEEHFPETEGDPLDPPPSPGSAFSAEPLRPARPLQGLPPDDALLPIPSAEEAEPPSAAPDVASPPASNSPEVRDQVVVPGWEPATELHVPWAEIPDAEPAADTWEPQFTEAPKPPSRAPEKPRPFASFEALDRPAAAAIPGAARGADEAAAPPRSPRHGGDRQRPARPSARPDTGQPRSWTRTGLVAIAALAVVLIGWNLTHSGAKSAPPAHPTRHVTAPVSPKPSAAASTSPAATPAPLTLSGIQTVGSTGSGYSVSTVRYGVHGSQYWVVFQFLNGSGPPKITAGFDGPTTMYIEMAGVAAGTPVPQPPSGQLVTSITPGKVPGFSGAVYILQLSKAVQLTPSLVPGNDSGGPGERYLAIVQ